MPFTTRGQPRPEICLLTVMLASACGSDDAIVSRDGGGTGGARSTASGGNSGGEAPSSSSGGSRTSSGGSGAGSGGRVSAGGAPPAAGGSANTDGGAPATAGCAPLPVTGHAVTVKPGDDLAARVRDAKSGDTLLLEDGTYSLSGVILQLKTDGVTLRGKSGDREKVILDGERSQDTGEVISVTASDVTIADLTIANAYTHAIHVQTSGGTNVLRTTIYDVHVVDALEQGIKINLDATEQHFPDDGLVACSHIELTASARSAVRNNCYTGGIDGHGARRWTVRDNVIEGFWCPSGLSEHGVHFWTGSRDTVVERNRIENCARGVGFGLGENDGTSTDAWRTYADQPCGDAAPVGHYGGIVRNNFIHANDAGLFASESGFDSGVALEQACEATVVHNTIYGTTAPLSSAVEWRFGATSATVTNNLANAAFKNRGGGATEVLAGNLATAAAALFVDASQGDLHLASGATAARGKGASVPGGVCDDDIDGDDRPSARDVGADQTTR